MKTTRPFQAKIVNHAEGLGAPDPSTVRQRAKELAQIDGRTEITESDWQQAKSELHGGHSFYTADGDEEMMSRSVSERDMIAVDFGHHVENISAENSDTMAEELIAEGMDEAVHEQMLQASKVDAEDMDESE
jgi:hypothetical protein